MILKINLRFFKTFVNGLINKPTGGLVEITLEKLEKGDQYTFSKKVDYPFDYQTLKTDVIKFSNTEATEDIIKGINSFGMSGHGESTEVNFDDEKETVVITIKKAETSIEKKFELVKESARNTRNSNAEEITVYRIRALRDFTCPFKLRPDGEILDTTLVKKGDLGGWVEKEENLSQEDGCWIFNDAQVRENARVEGNARITGRSFIRGNAVVKGYSYLSGSANVYGNAVLDDCTRMDGMVSIGDDSTTNGTVNILNYSQVHGKSKLSGDIYLGGAVVIKDANIAEGLHLVGNYTVAFDVNGSNTVAAYRTTEFAKKQNDYGIERNGYDYFTASTKADIWSTHGFLGTGEELIQFVERSYPASTEYYRNLVEYHKKQYSL